MSGNLFRAGRGESVASLIINRVTGVVRNDTPRPLNLAKLQRMRFQGLLGVLDAFLKKTTDSSHFRIPQLGIR